MSEYKTLIGEFALLDAQIEIRLKRIAELKEALRAGAKDMIGEVMLLGELSQEINALRGLREARFLKRILPQGLEIAPVYMDVRESVSRPQIGLM